MMKTYKYIILFFLLVTNAQAQEKEQDTLFFNFDKSYIEESTTHANEFYIKDRNNGGMFFFKAVKVLYNLKPKQILCLEKFIRQPKFYDETKTNKLKNYELMIYFSSNIVVYLVRNKNDKTEYVKIEPVIVVSD